MDSDFIPTKGAQVNQKAKKQFQTVTFESYKRKQKKEIVKDDSDTIQDKPVEINMKRARHEIVKFALTGFTKKRKENTKIDLAIRLGAKPPKNKYRNYKEILALRKEQKERAAKKKANMQRVYKTGVVDLSKINTKKPSENKKQRGILKVYGKPSKEMLKKGKDK